MTGIRRARLHGDRDRVDGVTAHHHTPALSASRLQLYRECPALYERRYVLGIYDPPTIDMEYGQAIHHGLEALFNGADAELCFMRELRRRLEPLIAEGADPADWLVPQGLRLLDLVSRLGYAGQPERRFIFVQSGFTVPFRGILDLWMPDASTVVDWKTTQRQWSDKTAERYLLQRAIYAQASMTEFGQPVRFQFVALGAYPGGTLQVVEATPTLSEIEDAFTLAYELHQGIEAGHWACTCRDRKHEAKVA